MAKDNTRWFQDRYFITFAGMMVVIVAVIMANPFLLTTQNEKIIDRIDDLAAEREEEGQIQTKTILDNMSAIIVTNQKRIIDSQQQVLDNITQILFNVTNTTQVVENQTHLLEDIIKAQNITVTIGEHTDATTGEEELYANLSRQNQTTDTGSGSISGIGKPQVIIP